MITVRVPASTSNLGPGFDVLGLALELYLEVKAFPLTDGPECSISLAGEGSSELPTGSENLIWRVMKHVARSEQIELPPLQLEIENNIPLARGLGSSAAAVVAGLKLVEVISRRPLSIDRLLQYAVHFEGHADNVSPALLGGFVTNSVLDDGSVLAVKLEWPADIRVL